MADKKEQTLTGASPVPGWEGLRERLLKELRAESCQMWCRRKYPETLSAWCLICLNHAAADEIEAASLPSPPTFPKMNSAGRQCWYAGYEAGKADAIEAASLPSGAPLAASRLRNGAGVCPHCGSGIQVVKDGGYVVLPSGAQRERIEREYGRRLIDELIPNSVQCRVAGDGDDLPELLMKLVQVVEFLPSGAQEEQGEREKA